MCYTWRTFQFQTQVLIGYLTFSFSQISLVRFNTSAAVATVPSRRTNLFHHSFSDAGRLYTPLKLRSDHYDSSLGAVSCAVEGRSNNIRLSVSHSSFLYSNWMACIRQSPDIYLLFIYLLIYLFIYLFIYSSTSNQCNIKLDTQVINECY